MQFHLPLVCVVLMPVNLDFFESWAKTARVTITLVNQRIMEQREAKRAGKTLDDGRPPLPEGAPALFIRRSIQQFSSQLTKQVCCVAEETTKKGEKKIYICAKGPPKIVCHLHLSTASVVRT